MLYFRVITSHFYMHTPTHADRYLDRMAMAQSMSVSDRRKMFELESAAAVAAATASSSSTGSSNAIHDSPRKTKPPLTKRMSSPNITVRSTTTGKKSESTAPVKKSSIFSRKNSSSSSDSKKVNRASSDADVLESKRNKYQNSKSMDQASSPKHSKSNETSPTHTGTDTARRESARKRREPPKPPSQTTVSPKGSPQHKPQDSKNGHKSSKAEAPIAKPRGGGEKPPRPPSPKNIVRDKDLDITLSDGGCVC